MTADEYAREIVETAARLLIRSDMTDQQLRIALCLLIEECETILKYRLPGSDV